MSDVVAVALITGSLTVLGSLGTGALAIWRERIRLKGERERFRQELESQEKRFRAESTLATRAQAVEVLRDWIRHAVAMSVDVEFLMLHKSSETRKMVGDLLEKMMASAGEASINVALATVSDFRVIKKVREIEQTKAEIRTQLSPARELAANAPLDDVR